MAFRDGKDHTICVQRGRFSDVDVTCNRGFLSQEDVNRAFGHMFMSLKREGAPGVI